ncbi:BQ2448_6066 [Microbotryum intermedium]|uniref:BQ2448_6066 protein n=1 Tax=Microbotryum intermedium TaxID=269621 RepID=A0A238FRA9_9BASI|nr:BQ2448_6066 [Microbotryum intermedium]
MGSFVALPEVAPPVEQPTLVLPPPLHNYNSYQGDQFQEESIRQISTYTAVHRHNYGPRTPALPTYELVPGGQLDGIVPCETSGKMVPEPLVATTTAATFDSNQLQWPLPDGRTGLTPVGTIPTGCSPWPTW